MITIVFVAVFGTIVLGFALWVLAFGGMKRRGQSSQEVANAQKMNGGEEKRSA